MTQVIDFKSMVTKLRNIDPTSFEDMKKQIVESVQTAPEHEMQSTPVATLRKLSGMPEAKMSDKSIKKVRKTVDKMDDKPKVKKSISKWAKGKFDDPKAAMFAIATNMQKRKQGKKINPPGRESVSFIGKALIDEPKTLRGKLEEAMRTPNFVLENLKYQGEFDVGMKVRAFDHQPGVPGREDKYIEGEIIAVDAESKSQPGSMGYHVKVEKDTLFTKNSRVGKTVFVPYEISMDYDNRITSARPDDEDEAKAMSKMEDSEYDKDGKPEQDHSDHEVNMAQSDMFKAMKYAKEIHDALERVSEREGIEGWVAAKITKAADYLGSVAHYIEHEIYHADMAGEDVNEGSMSDIALDMKQLSDAEFKKKHGKSKEEMKKELSEGADKARAIRIDKMMRANGMDTLADLLADAMHFAEITGLDFGAEVDKAQGYYDDADQQEEGNAYAHTVRKAKMDGKKKGDKVKGPDGKEITIEKDPQHEALVDKTIKTLETYLDLVGKQGDAKLSKATENVRKVFGMEEKAKPDYIDIDKDGDKKEPMKKAVKDKEKKSSGKKMTMDQKIKLLNVGKQVREKAKEHGVQPSQFLGYLVAKDPEKYGALAKLESIIDGQG